MAGEINRHPGQSSLCVCDAHVPSTRLQANGRGRDRLRLCLVDDLVDVGVIGHKELVARGLREALRAVPGHVVQRHESAVCQEEVVEQSAADDNIVGALDDRGEGCEA